MRLASSRIASRLAWCLPAALLSLAGCGGAGNEASPPATPPVAVADAPESQAPGKAPAPSGGKLGESVTPVREVDTSKVVDVVKEEIKGGEATAAVPTSIDHLWAMPDSSKIAPAEVVAITPPKGLGPITALIPAANPMTQAKLDLGKQLYFDARISKDTTVSCATCHNPEKAWTDNLPTSVGILGQVGGRNAPTVLNTVYGKTMFWDGRAPSLEGQAQGPPQNKIEMGDQSYGEIVNRLRTIPSYREQFQKVFGTDVTLDGVAKAIATFERTAFSGNSPYDRYNLASKDESPEDLKALTDSQKRGMVLFGLRLNADDEFKPEVTLKKANCTSCHIGANFTDEQFHNLGVGFDVATNKFADIGRFEIAPVGAKNPAEQGAFKTPSLRDIERTFPYMHDGKEKTLVDVVEYYDRGGNANPWIDKDMKKLGLTPQEKQDLVEFMKALNGEIIKVELPTLPPGPDGKAPNPRDALTPPSPKTALGDVHAPVR
ncbi:cytochrome c peroxidase [Isosphaeraceae bacterium EP7]